MSDHTLWYIKSNNPNKKTALLLNSRLLKVPSTSGGRFSRCLSMWAEVKSPCSSWWLPRGRCCKDPIEAFWPLSSPSDVLWGAGYVIFFGITGLWGDSWQQGPQEPLLQLCSEQGEQWGWTRLLLLSHSSGSSRNMQFSIISKKLIQGKLWGPED